MKKLILRSVALLLLLLIVGGVWTNWPLNLDVSQTAVPRNNGGGQAALRLSTITTGYMPALKMFSVRGGGMEELKSGMLAVVVDHPQGSLLIDTGFSRNVDAHFALTPALMQAFSKVVFEQSAKDVLTAAGRNVQSMQILLTHGHWDHSSGLADFATGNPADTQVLMHPAGIEWLASGDPNAALTASFRDQVSFTPIAFAPEPYRGFDASVDIYGDGSVVVVDMAGHTPGSVGVFVNLASGKQYFFTGDTTWLADGFNRPAERPWLLRQLVDVDETRVRQHIRTVHQLQKAMPELVVVPAHDAAVHKTLPAFPAYIE